jgi:gamma-glutamyltranspeptidase/glutathione hydrolase
MEVLERGGSAIDAAIAGQAMLSLVEPQSSGLGGGAFMNFYDARTKRLTIYDGREVAPGSNGNDVPQAGQQGIAVRSSGAERPRDRCSGAVKMLELAHCRTGNLEWRTLFGAAERTADGNYIVSPRLGRLLAGNYAENSAPDVVAFSPPGGAT